MAVPVDAKTLAERALRRIGRYARHDSGADPEDLNIALDALDAAIKELAIERIFWLVPATVDLTLTADENPIDIVAKSGNIPAGSLQSVYDLQISRPTGGAQAYQRDLIRVPRLRYNQLADKDSSGYPVYAFIDRTLLNPLVYLQPVPGDGNYVLHISYQKYPEDVTDAQGRTAHGLDQAWERWADYQIASDIGDGPLARVPAEEIQRWERKAETARSRLLRYQNRESVSPRMVAHREF